MADREYERGCLVDKVDETTSNVSRDFCSYKLNVFDWLGDIDDPLAQNKYIEVRFKNTRKEIFLNASDLQLKVGDIVAVEASPGHDIGIVSAIGNLANQHVNRQKFAKDQSFKKIYRKARAHDIQKWKDAISLEIPTMLRTREFADSLGLEMKIGDVEFQGDKTKAIFYYIAEDRVDFRELIKKMAEEFKIRIEMKQIGARQEAGKIGGIGPCGRELCCTTWIYDFVSVSTNSARLQELSLNPQKLAGQCIKLKCCLNYELEVYLDARKNFPDDDINLKLAEGEAIHIKNDVFKNLMYYEIKINDIPVSRALDVDKVKEIIELNKKGIFPEKVFDENSKVSPKISLSFKEELNSDSLTRFDTSQKPKQKNRRNKNRHNKFRKPNEKKN